VLVILPEVVFSCANVQLHNGTVQTHKRLLLTPLAAEISIVLTITAATS